MPTLRLFIDGGTAYNPQSIEANILRSLHYGHPGRDSMLAAVANIW